MTTDEKIRLGLMTLSVVLPVFITALGFSMGPLDDIGGGLH
ncbi:MAG: hypothetical protein OK422_02080 [Thaumarchaeota archaeon]|nr:hypothetical protein [Nitrososphaerota archaeon]